MTTRSLRIPHAAGATVALAATLVLSGCAVKSTLQTDVPYNAADGVPVDLGPVDIRNLLVVAPAKGGPGTLSGSVINPTGSAVTVMFSDAGGGSAQVDVPAHTTQGISTEGRLVTLPTVAVGPGEVLQLAVRTAEAGVNVATVPVLGAQSYYETLRPTSTGTATP